MPDGTKCPGDRKRRHPKKDESQIARLNHNDASRARVRQKENDRPYQQPNKRSLDE